MTDVDVSAVGVFMLLSYSELRGLLVLVSPPPPPPWQSHHHAGAWDFIHNHCILMVMSILQHYIITTLHNSVNTREECNRMPDSNEPQIFISLQNHFPPSDVTVFASVLSVGLTELTCFHVACWEN